MNLSRRLCCRACSALLLYSPLLRHFCLQLVQMRLDRKKDLEDAPLGIMIPVLGVVLIMIIVACCACSSMCKRCIRTSQNRAVRVSHERAQNSRGDTANDLDQASTV